MSRCVGYCVSLWVLLAWVGVLHAQPWTSVRLEEPPARTEPMTGLVLWAGTPATRTHDIQLEYSYMLYRDVVDERGAYDWSVVDELLADVASRGHQAILRFRFIYPGDRVTAVPDSIRRMPDYRETLSRSEGQRTAFCDWSHPALQAFAIEFHTRFADRYDDDPRLAFVQVGFGLWAEYHIYDGPMRLGRTFPSKAYQARFLKHVSEVYEKTPWSISIDAAEEERTPFSEHPELQELRFGNFDDSFLHKQHHAYNESCWDFFGRQRFLLAPAGGELSYYTRHDQERAMAPDGPHGERFEAAARRFGISYMLANDQPGYQSVERFNEASRSLGYAFTVHECVTNGSTTRVTISNSGIAPIYFDAYPSVGGVRSEQSLLGLAPGQRAVFEIPVGGERGVFAIACDRLVAGQAIGFRVDPAGSGG